MNACGNCGVCGGPMRNELFTSLCEPYCPRDCGVNSKPAVQGRQRWWVADVGPAELNKYVCGSWQLHHPSHPEAGKGDGCWAFIASGMAPTEVSKGIWQSQRATTWELAPEPDSERKCGEHSNHRWGWGGMCIRCGITA